MKHIQQVIPAAIAISCYFDFFRFRYGLVVADNFSKRPEPEQSYFVTHALFSSWLCGREKNVTTVGAAALVEANGTNVRSQRSGMATDGIVLM
ncbi:hypothetical protein [Bradyrhizobium sp.]|uniref:hypothetical protein n=1 Tax=Bradyrhizobium sp. TaxID=376 RepID=UPI003C31799F